MTSEETKEEYTSEINKNIPSNPSETFPSTTTSKIPFIEWTSKITFIFFGSHKAGIYRDNEFLDTSFNYCKQLFERDGDIIITDYIQSSFNNTDQNECMTYYK